MSENIKDNLIQIIETRLGRYKEEQEKAKRQNAKIWAKKRAQELIAYRQQANVNSTIEIMWFDSCIPNAGEVLEQEFLSEELGVDLSKLQIHKSFYCDDPAEKDYSIQVTFQELLDLLKK